MLHKRIGKNRTTEWRVEKRQVHNTSVGEKREPGGGGMAIAHEMKDNSRWFWAVWLFQRCRWCCCSFLLLLLLINLYITKNRNSYMILNLYVYEMRTMFNLIARKFGRPKTDCKKRNRNEQSPIRWQYSTRIRINSRRRTRMVIFVFFFLFSNLEWWKNANTLSRLMSEITRYTEGQNKYEWIGKGSMLWMSNYAMRWVLCVFVCLLVYARVHVFIFGPIMNIF